jgi:hypothetical protein
VASHELSILPVDLPCNMDSYGLIMRSDHVLTPGANLLLKHIRRVASSMYAAVPQEIERP